MIQRCPNCGQWCMVEKEGVIDRASNSYREAVVSDAETGKNFGRRLGMKGVGEFFGAAVGSYRGMAKGLMNGLFGYKYQFICPKCNHEWETDDDSDDETEEYEEYQRLCELVNPENVKKWVASNTEAELDELSKKWIVIANTNDETSFRAMSYDALAYYNHKVRLDVDSAKNFLELSQSLIADPSIKASQAMMTPCPDNPSDAYKRLCALVSYYNHQENAYFERHEIEAEIARSYDVYVNGFTTLLPEEREIIIVVRELASLTDNVLDSEIKILLSSKIPDGLKSIEGRFQINTPYVCHPYKPDRYLRYENHEDILFQDEMRDLQRFLGLLGARRIIISRSECQGTDRNDASELSAHGEVKKGKLNIKGGYDSDQSSSLKQMLSKTLNIGSEMERGIEPVMPPFTGWAQQISWQDFAENRFQTGLLNHTLEVSTSEAQAIDRNRHAKIEAEISALVAKANGGVETRKSHASSLSSDQMFLLSVDFYPLSSYKTTPEPEVAPTQQPTAALPEVSVSNKETESALPEEQPKRNSWWNSLLDWLKI